jgi:hypothetical protein
MILHLHPILSINFAKAWSSLFAQRTYYKALRLSESKMRIAQLWLIFFAFALQLSDLAREDFGGRRQISRKARQDSQSFSH